MRTFRDQGRGRPRGRSNPYQNLQKSILSIARKYSLNPKLLLNAFIKARENKISHYGNFQIQCRAMNQEFITFLITNNEKVVSQFPVKQELFQDPNLINFVPDLPNSHLRDKKKNQKNQKITDLTPGMKGVDVKAKIMEIPPKKLIITKWGSQSYVTNAIIADETGKIKLSLWNSAIDQVHVGDEIELKNCYVAIFAGENQLRIGRKGLISIVDRSPV